MIEVKVNVYTCKQCGFETELKPKGFPKCPVCGDKKKTLEDRKKSISY